MGMSRVWWSCRPKRKPFSVEILLGLLNADLRDGDQSNIGEVGRHDLQIAIVGGSQVEAHVGLPRADPNFADEHIAERDAVLAFDGQGERRADFHRGEFDLPIAPGVGGCGVALAGDGHGDLLIGISPAPDGVLLVALKDHVVAENIREADVGVK